MYDDEFVNTFIIHLIFYAIFCFSLVAHIIFDFGLGSFIKINFARLKILGNKNDFAKKPVFA